MRVVNTNVYVELLKSADEEQYEKYLLGKEGTLIYQSLKYRFFLEKLLKDKSFYLVAKENGNIKGVLPIMVRCNDLYGCIANSLPFYGSNGSIIADNSDVFEALINEYMRIADEKQWLAGTIISSPFDKNDLYFQQNIKPFFLDKRIGQVTYLPPNNIDYKEAIFEMIYSSARRNIRKARKGGICVDIDNSDSSIEFLYMTHRKNIEKINGIAKKRSFFEVFPRVFEEKMDYNIYIAHKGGRKIAALLVLYYNKTVEYFTPAIVEENRTDQPLPMIIYQAMCDAVKRGFKYWNWGGTWLTQDGVYAFKKKWGSVDLPYYYYTYIFNKDILQLNKDEVLKNYENYFVYPFDGGVSIETV